MTKELDVSLGRVTDQTVFMGLEELRGRRIRAFEAPPVLLEERWHSPFLQVLVSSPMTGHLSPRYSWYSGQIKAVAAETFAIYLRIVGCP